MLKRFNYVLGDDAEPVSIIVFVFISKVTENLRENLELLLYISGKVQHLWACCH